MSHLGAVRGLPIVDVDFPLHEWLIRDWTSFGIPEPETFPKQPCLNKDIHFGCALRVPGRRHTRPHWTRVLTPHGPLVGAEACKAILATTGVPSSLIPVEARDYRTASEMIRAMSAGLPKAAPRSLASSPSLPIAEDELVRRVRKYLEKRPPAIQGQRGDDRLRDTVWAILNTFPRLSTDQVFPLLLEWNQRCMPPFNDAEVWSKLSRAARKIG